MPFQLDLTDLRNILDLIATPCLLVNADTSEIETGNFSFSQFSGYSLDEIRNVALGTLVSDINLQSVTDGGSKGSVLILKFDDPLPVELNFRYIGPNGSKILITLSDERVLGNQNLDDIAIQLIDILKELPVITKFDLYEKIVNALSQSKIAEDYALYSMQESQQTYLTRYGSNDPTKLPSEIPALELERIIQMDIWKPGRRVLSEIHRAARDHHFLCMYSMPILRDGKTKSILVLGYQSETYNEQRERTIHQIGRLISSILEYSDNYLNALDEMYKISSSLDKYQAEFEISRDGIIVVDQSNTIVDFNTPFTKIFFYTPVEIKNKNISTLFGYSRSTEIINFINNSTNQTRTEFFNLVDRKGQDRYFEITLVPLTATHNDQKLLIFHDRSEVESSKKMIEGLEKQASLGEMLAEFAHDARNIINRQTTGIQLLSKKYQLSGGSNTEILGLLEECDNLSDMMESVLSYSRQDKGEFEVINLADFIQSLIYRNKFRAEKAGVEIRFINRLNEAKIHGYQRSLERVLLNLINNAIDATRQDQGMVSVTLQNDESNPGQAVIKISDTGPGIPEKISSILLTNQFSDKPSGTGLGLLISNKIIQAHNGRLTIESFSGGTIFSINLPMHNQGEEI